jgi:hypothetical protein
MSTLVRDVWLLSVGATLLAILILLLLFWLLRKRQNLYVAFLLIAVAYDKLTGVIGIPLFLDGDAVPSEYAWLRTSGTIVVFMGIVVYGLHRFGLLNGITSDEPKPPADAPPQ